MVLNVILPVVIMPAVVAHNSVEHLLLLNTQIALIL